MENQNFELLEKSDISPILLNVLQGDVIPDNPSTGELIFLASYLPKERYPELLPYLSELPYLVLVNMYATYEDDDSESFDLAMLTEIKKKSQNFDQKLTLLGFIDEDEDSDYFQSLFIEVVDMCDDFADCMLVMSDVADTPQEIELVLEKMRTFNPSFEDWLELQENYPNYNARIGSLKEMIALAQEQEYIFWWLLIYKHCLSGSANEKLALENIASFNLDANDWEDIYFSYDNDEDYRIINLTIKNLQELKADFNIWLNLLDDDLSGLPISDDLEKVSPNPIILGMLLESETATLDGLHTMYQYLYSFPHLQLAVMQKMMSLADAS